ncbi:helix-turn-helix domain-containing protein [Kitasatospora sp. NPDC127111]|uniref:helix-turn-helix domain-containing protein n=1 Tax=Kitasatospora sp. NPDC127111 TaxID=3345363 RepID=UPI00363174FA
MANATIAADLITRAKSGDRDAMWQIVTTLEPMLANVVRTVTAGQATAEDMDDLMQEARIALITCVASYDTDGTAQLQTKAWPAIRGAVATAWMGGRPGALDPQKLVRVRRALAQADGDVDKAFQVVNEIGPVSRQLFDAARFALVPVESLDRPADGVEGVTLGETLADISSAADAADVRDLAAYALASVTARRALVLRGTYGIGMPPMEDAEIGGHMGVGPARVRRIRWDGIQQARAVLGIAA